MKKSFCHGRLLTFHTQTYGILMKIGEYLVKHKLTYLDFSRLLKVSEQSVRRWTIGVRPHKRVAAKVTKKTNQEVTMKDLGWE